LVSVDIEIKAYNYQIRAVHERNANYGSSSLYHSHMKDIFDLSNNYLGSSLGRPAQPVTLAPIFVFRESDEVSYITREVFEVTGGKSLP